MEYNTGAIGVVLLNRLGIETWLDTENELEACKKR